MLQFEQQKMICFMKYVVGKVGRYTLDDIPKIFLNETKKN